MDLGYSTELVVLGRVLPQMKEQGLAVLLGIFNGSFISLNDHGELDDHSEYVGNVCNVLDDAAVLGVVNDYEQEINLWRVKLALANNLHMQLKQREYYTSEEAIEVINKNLKIDSEKDESVLAAFIRDFVQLYKNTPYYDILCKKYEKYFYVHISYYYGFTSDKDYEIYAQGKMFYFLYRNEKNVSLRRIKMDNFDEVFNEFAMRSSSIPSQDSIVMEKVWG